ncbi:hypothetical protein GCM10010156_60060 [Planobispora rosea]|uniref:DUF3558 domain-containing protein n=1 Tax=Planobispora rosea TaxID=35762 RepID=A0A8J3S523_PLARO|nr:hypothetical protein [Planobispora rosea]GGS93737.1 hypothetical protein GCM10010156_60060 [Planobispora rosea]GIH87308.1 hypothetical protein Pro02_57160 [Planobispora rosea]
MTTSDSRRRWLAPAVAGGTALAVAGGVIAYAVSRPGAGTTEAAPAASATPAVHSPDDPPDVCSMIGRADAERLAPRATARSSSSGDSTATTWTCTWNGSLLPDELGTAGRIELQIKRYKGAGRDAEIAATRQYANDIRLDQSATSRTDEDYAYTPVRRFSGIGDSSHGQYSRSRTGNGYDEAKGYSRVGDVTVQVKHHPGGRSAPPLPTGDIPSAVGKEMLREVESLLRQASESVAAWRAGKPYARPASPAATPAPAGTPTPVPVDFSANCAKFSLAAFRFVPEPKTGAARTVQPDRTVTDCWWENTDIPVDGGLRLRNVSISTVAFTDRAGGPDPEGARRHYEERRTRAVKRARDGKDPEFPGISFGRATDLQGVAERAYMQPRQHRTSELRVGVASGLMLVGATVVEVSYVGSDRPRGTGIGSPTSVLMPEKEAVARFVPLVKAVAAAAGQ